MNAKTMQPATANGTDFFRFVQGSGCGRDGGGEDAWCLAAPVFLTSTRTRDHLTSPTGTRD